MESGRSAQINTICSEQNQRTTTKVLVLRGSEARNEAVGCQRFQICWKLLLGLALAAEFLLDLAGKSAELS